MGNKAQRGALLIELAIGIAVLTLIAVGTVSWMSQQAEKTKIESLAVAMQTVQQGVQALLNTHALELMSQSEFTLAGINDWQQPTVEELQQLGFLAPSFAVNQAIGVVLHKEGDCPGAQCHIHALVYLKQPLLNKKQQLDMHAVAHWQEAVQGAGLVVLPQKSTFFSGSQLMVALQDLPLGLSFPVGSVALLASSHAATEDVVAGRYLVLPHTERLGETCALSGAVARDEEGRGLLVCEQDQWIRAAAEVEPGSLEEFKAMISAYWKIDLPEDTPGGFYIKQKYYYSFHCWVPNPLNIYTDGRGICNCLAPYTAKLVKVPSVKDSYFKIGIARPSLSMYICV